LRHGGSLSGAFFMPGVRTLRQPAVGTAASPDRGDQALIVRPDGQAVEPRATRGRRRRLPASGDF
jgi:hypothetical protein